MIEAFVAPTLQMSRDPRCGSMVFMKLLGRLHAEGDLLPRILTSQFGDVFQRFEMCIRDSSQPVDADILAQPLYVPGLTINGAVHNVAFVATLNNSVYAFDADTSQPALWQASLGTPVPIGTTSQPTTGILSTPVIDLNLKVIFVVTFTYESKTAVYRLHALNLVTGVAITNIVVRGAVAGTGDDSQATACTSGNGGTVPPPCIPFKAHEQFQRPALLEGALSSTIYLGFGNLNGQEITTPCLLYTSRCV